jgi:drug/metabolite transporter (DMT)-like permease
VHLTARPSGAPEGGFAPRAIAVWRILAGALVLAPIAWARHRESFLAARAELPRLFACSVLGITANMVLALEGTSRTSVLHAGLLLTLIPVFTYAIAVLAGVERHRPRSIAGIALALAGAAWLVLGRGAASSAAADDGGGAGNAMILANSLSYACYLVLARGLLRRLPTLVVIAWAFVLAVPTLPLVAMGADLVPSDVAPGALVGLAYLIVGATILAYLLNTFALARVGASTTASFIYMQPLIAGASGVLVLGERPGLGALGAAVCLLSGLGLVALGHDPRAESAGGPQRRSE